MNESPATTLGDVLLLTNGERMVRGVLLGDRICRSNQQDDDDDHTIPVPKGEIIKFRTFTSFPDVRLQICESVEGEDVDEGRFPYRIGLYGSEDKALIFDMLLCVSDYDAKHYPLAYLRVVEARVKQLLESSGDEYYSGDISEEDGTAILVVETHRNSPTFKELVDFADKLVDDTFTAIDEAADRVLMRCSEPGHQSATVEAIEQMFQEELGNK